MTEQTKNWRYVRLTNGENIIADFEPIEGGTKALLSYPFQIVVDRGRGGMELLMVPWLPTNASDDVSVQVDNHHILFSVALTEAVIPTMNRYAEKLYERQPKPTAADVQDGELSTDETLDALSKLFEDPSKRPN